MEVIPRPCLLSEDLFSEPFGAFWLSGPLSFGVVPLGPLSL